LINALQPEYCVNSPWSLYEEDLSSIQKIYRFLYISTRTEGGKTLTWSTNFFVGTKIKYSNYFYFGASTPRCPIGALVSDSQANLFKKKFFLPPSTLSRICFYSMDNETVRPASSDSRTVHMTSLSGFEGVFYFSFMFILTECLKNHSKL